MHIWLNRFPVPHLEGYEHLIQDPYKLNDEVRGRKEEYAYLLEKQLGLLEVVRSHRRQFRGLEEDLENKQQAIAKLCKDIDDKTDSLRLAASEVLDLKRKIDRVKTANA